MTNSVSLPRFYYLYGVAYNSCEEKWSCLNTNDKSSVSFSGCHKLQIQNCKYSKTERDL